MKCPKCPGATLHPGRTADRLFDLDTCPTCKGIWFDTYELSDTLGRTQGEECTPSHAFENKNVKCPRCKEALFEYCYPKTTILVDGCKKCHGVWLDRSEWPAIKEALYQKPKKVCPKCHVPQTSVTACTHCGVIFEKLAQQKQAEQEEVARAAEGNQLRSEWINTVFTDAVSYKIKQCTGWLEILSPFELKNRYEIVILAQKNYFGCVYENSVSFFNMIGRQLFGSWRPANLLFEDENRNLILHMKKKFRFYFHYLEIKDASNKKLGFIERRFHLFRSNYEIRDAYHRVVMNVRGPFFHLPFTDQKFLFKKKNQDVGHVSKEWRGALREYFTDGDTFHSVIDRTLSVEEKILLFGAVFLIDFVCFEENQGSGGGGVFDLID